MKIKNYILPFIALILVLYYVITNMSGEKQLTYKLLPEDLAIKKIVYKNDDLLFTMVEEEKGWHLSEPENWPADVNKVNDILTNLNNTEIITNISASNSSEDNDKKYGFDKGNYLLLNGSKEVKMYIGKKDSSYKMVYVKLENENKIKLVNASFTNYLPISLNQIKDKTIYSFDTENLEKFSFNIDNNQYEIIRSGDRLLINNKILDDNVTTEYIKNIASLEADTFYDNNTMPDNVTKAGIISIKTKDMPKTNLVIYHSKKENDYLIPSDGESVFKIYNFSMERFIEKFSKTTPYKEDVKKED